MRMTAPLIAGSAIALAVAFAWYVRSASEPSVEPPAERAPLEIAVAPPRVDSLTTPESAPAAPGAEPAANAAPEPQRSPLPGEAPTTPMTQVLADRELNMIVGRASGGDSAIPLELAEGEREFAAEPIDSTWAAGAEARLLAVFAAMPGLELIDLQAECRSTMCRLQLTQPPAEPGQDRLQPFNILRDQTGMTPRWMMVVVDGFPNDRVTTPLPMRSIAYLWREGFAPGKPAGAADDGSR